MANSIDEFKTFVKKYPKLKFEVRDGKRSWQSIYEEWTLLGDDGSWEDFKESTNEIKVDSSESQEFLRSALQYVKKINPDDITKTVGTVQKVLSIVQSFSGGKNNQSKVNYSPRRRIDPLFRRYDDYDD